MIPNHTGPMLNLGPIIANYSPISSKGGKRRMKSRKFISRKFISRKNKKNKTNKIRTRRRYR